MSTAIKTFSSVRVREDAVEKLAVIGFKPRTWQAGGDYEDFVDVEGHLLLVDFVLGRFIIDRDGKVVDHNSVLDGTPWFDDLLDALYLGGAI